MRKKSRKSKKCECEDLSEKSNNSWSVVLDSTGELEHVANVLNKIKKTKNNSYPTNPIKTILLEVIHASKLEKNKNSQHDTFGVTAIAAVQEAGPELCPKCKTGKFCIKTSSKKCQNEKYLSSSWQWIGWWFVP